MGYIRPVPYSGISSWRAHTRRVPPSKEAGVDYYCPIGTPVIAPAAGRVVDVGGSISAATGRYVTVDFDDGRRARFLHLLRQDVRNRQFVRPGDRLGLSGASGYGSEFFGAPTLARIPANTGGPHVHVTLWPRHAYSFGVNAGTLDFDAYADRNAPAGGGGSPITVTVPKEDDDMLMLTLHGIGSSTHKVALGLGVFRHFVPTDPFEKIKNLARIQDDWQDVSYAELPALLRTYGCDLNIWDWNPSAGGFCILDPLTGLVKPGNVWTAAGATRAAIAGIVAPAINPAPIVAAVEAAIAKGIQLDEKAIAKAVNDDAAKRMVS